MCFTQWRIIQPFLVVFNRALWYQSSETAEMEAQGIFLRTVSWADSTDDQKLWGLLAFLGSQTQIYNHLHAEPVPMRSQKVEGSRAGAGAGAGAQPAQEHAACLAWPPPAGENCCLTGLNLLHYRRWKFIRVTPHHCALSTAHVWKSKKMKSTFWESRCFDTESNTKWEKSCEEQIEEASVFLLNVI